MMVILCTGSLVEVVNIAILFKIHFTRMKGRVFVVGLFLWWGEGKHVVALPANW
jgi:hypothetical protein